MRPDLRKVDKPVDLAKQVIVRDMPFQAEAIKQRLLLHSPFAGGRESPMLPFVQGAVKRGAMVHTDGWRGYAGLAAAGYQHQVTVLSGGSDPAHEVMPRVHLVASLLKRWLIGTHQGGVQHQHLDYYLDEFTFRFNRRRSKAR